MSQTISREMMEVVSRVSKECEIHIHRDYSGRFMYGDECLGLSFSGSPGNLFAAFLRELEWFSDYIRAEAAEMFDDMRSDNLGLGTIFYFPGWKVEEGTFEEEEETADKDWDDEETDE